MTFLTEQDIAKFWANVDRTGDCWLWTGGALHTFGYGTLHVSQPKVKISTHRISWLIHNGAIPEGMCVLHNCPGGDNPLCVNPAHLFLGSRADNMADRQLKGRTPSTWRGAKSYFTPEHIRTIRKRIAYGDKPSLVAGDFHVTTRNIRCIAKRQTWRWVTD